MEAGAIRNAHQWFQLMVQTDLGPGLRALGFSGEGKRFRLVGIGQVGEIAILQTSTKATTRFTLVLSVNATGEWASQLRIRPYLRAAGHTAGAWQERIGDLMLVGAGEPIGDLWWQVEAGKPFAGTAEEVLTAVREFGLPAMRAQMSTRALTR
ncbi:DUF4304 domain-containing protein [Actinokineospora bangkokensis]|uniref:Uncharacterized protein n=1 Tax=Actinokineospora bangkokensis TaxID=1193682 RepID=A0A1Q9LG03_9PSEU|nr:DUF4304 domain-containing protein [Actinokineospora bangkokensis]OLR90953.1 hypothetical protein BJP25_30865 [Actinokineospora bangkokensis]